MKKHWQNYLKKTNCQKCGKEFDAYVHNLRRGWGKFCSRSCSKKGRSFNKGRIVTADQRQRISTALKKKYASGELISPLRKLGLIGRKGSEAMNWRGGRTLVGQAIRQSLQYKEWRKEVLRLQDYTCQFCKKRGGKLEVDHVEEFSTSPEKRLEVTNGRVLCKDCHKRVTGYRKADNVDLRKAFVEVLSEIAEEDKRLRVLTCDVGFRYLDKFQERHPGRYFNLGVTEQSSMLIATAMALDGLRPVIYSMINFVIFRPLEMLRNGVCYHNAPVIIAGVSGSKGYGLLGFSHNTTKNEEINLIWKFPNLRIRLPWTEDEVKEYIREAMRGNYPLYIRL